MRRSSQGRRSSPWLIPRLSSLLAVAAVGVGIQLSFDYEGQRYECATTTEWTAKLQR